MKRQTIRVSGFILVFISVLLALVQVLSSFAVISVPVVIPPVVTAFFVLVGFLFVRFS